MGLSGTYNEIKTLAKGFYQDARASHAGMKAEKLARNGIAKSKEVVQNANSYGRTAVGIANSGGRTAYRFAGNTKSNLINAGIGAAGMGAANVGLAYANGDGDYGRAALKGATLGAGLGAGYNIGRGVLWSGRNEFRAARYAGKARAATAYADRSMTSALRKPQLMLPAPRAGFVPSNVDSTMKRIGDFGPAGPNSFVRGTTARNYRG